MVFVVCTSMLSMSTATEAREPALIAIIIDDLGNQLVAGRRTVALDAPLTCAVMPHTAYGAKLAREAHAAGKEVMLHLPMQPMQMNRIAGPGEISLENNVRQLQRILATDLNSVPYVVGVNNHMGSLITRHPGHMRWLMDALAARGDLFFVDSVTTPASVAYETALESGVPAARRHVFLDDDPAAERVAEQFERLKHLARERGYAIGIGHPYAATLDYLERVLPVLREHGEFRLVPVSRIVAMLESGELQREELAPTGSLVALSEGTR
jgi:polysaccharide deacetylase 2 family uncharacterized protein YibQ